MENPYHILNISQDANKKEIVQAVQMAMKEKKYSLNQISSAQKNLLNPTKRLLADFLYPQKVKASTLKPIIFDIEKELKLVINEDYYDSTKL